MPYVYVSVYNIFHLLLLKKTNFFFFLLNKANIINEQVPGVLEYTRGKAQKPSKETAPYTSASKTNPPLYKNLSHQRKKTSPHAPA
jgi:hypothetical protein